MDVRNERIEESVGPGCEPPVSTHAGASATNDSEWPSRAVHSRVLDDAADWMRSAFTASPPGEMNLRAFVDQVTRYNTLAERGPTIAVASAAVPLLLLGLSASALEHQFAWTSACVLGLASVFTILRQAVLLGREREALRLSFLGHRWVGVLSEALAWPDRRVSAIARLLLTQFLPELKDGDSGALSREQRKVLYRRLAPRKAWQDPDLTVAILQALPVIGTEASILYVQRLARRAAFTGSGRRIRDVARTVLPVLETRIADRRAAEAAKRTTGAEHSADDQDEQTEFEGPRSDARVDARIREFEAELKNGQPGMRIGFLIASWGIIVPYTVSQCVMQFSDGHWPLGLTFAGLTALGTQLYRLTLTDRHKALARQLGELDDVRCIGRLAELLEWPDNDVRAIAIDALNRLLPRVKATDGIGLTVAQRAAIHHMLGFGNAESQADLLVNFMKALEQIGNSSDVPCVERLANAQPVTARERRVCDAASECLPYLMERSKVTQTSQTLLRASSALGLGTDSLVRAASSQEQTDPDQLLRPGDLGA